MQYIPRQHPEEKDVHQQTHTPPPMSYFLILCSTRDTGRGENAMWAEETQGSGSAGGSSQGLPVLSLAQ